MGVSVSFSYADWSALFPDFATTVSEAQADALFLMATGLHANDGTGPVKTYPQQLNLMNLLVAHLAQLMYGSLSQPVSPLVGRVSDATEGSVSVSTENLYPPGTAQWWQQTRWGSMYWAFTQQYRNFRYARGFAQRNMNPWVNPRGYQQ